MDVENFFLPSSILYKSLKKSSSCHGIAFSIPSTARKFAYSRSRLNSISNKRRRRRCDISDIPENLDSSDDLGCAWVSVLFARKKIPRLWWRGVAIALLNLFGAVYVYVLWCKAI